MTEEKPNLPDGTEWCEDTEAWFEEWRSSERTDGWDGPQWQFMFDTAIVHQLVYETAQFQLLGELRSRLAYMGLTFEPKPKKVEVRVTPFDEIRSAYADGHDKRKAVS